MDNLNIDGVNYPYREWRHKGRTVCAWFCQVCGYDNEPGGRETAKEARTEARARAHHHHRGHFGDQCATPRSFAQFVRALDRAVPAPATRRRDAMVPLEIHRAALSEDAMEPRRLRYSPDSQQFKVRFRDHVNPVGEGPLPASGLLYEKKKLECRPDLLIEADGQVIVVEIKPWLRGAPYLSHLCQLWCYAHLDRLQGDPYRLVLEYWSAEHQFVEAHELTPTEMERCAEWFKLFNSRPPGFPRDLPAKLLTPDEVSPWAPNFGTFPIRHREIKARRVDWECRPR